MELARRDKVTIFISTHFMNEAERCDRISLMHAGRVLVSDTPAKIAENHGVATLEDAFVACLKEAGAGSDMDEALRHRDICRRRTRRPLRKRMPRN